MNCTCGNHISETTVEEFDEAGRVARRTTTKSTIPVRCAAHTYLATYWTFNGTVSTPSSTYYIN